MVAAPFPQDKRGFFIVPQHYEGGGYYVYGTPENGAGQYAHPDMMTFLMRVANSWCAVESRKFGVGNISLADGATYKGHNSHRSGLDVDIRPVRKDGAHKGVLCTDATNYDREATKRLVELMWQTGMVEAILFNDTKIPRVRRWANHDNHIHIKLRGR